jgi:hypothetical protein
MRNRSLLAATIVLVLGAAPAPAGDATGAYAPYEDLVQVLADLTWHLQDDTYRFSPPKDPTGHDLYQLSLRRLENWEKRYPGRMKDVTSFGRAEALERLGEYARAADLYRQVGASDSPLAAKARDGETRATAFAEAAALPERGADFEPTLEALRRKLDAWGPLVQRTAGTPYQALALVEEERLERLASRLVVEHRRGIEQGDVTAERSLRFLIEKHVESKQLPAYIVALGDLYADFARDYVAARERPLEFDETEFVARTDRALDMYRKVATWDGAREKPEAQGRFTALDAWKHATLGRYR